MDVTIAGARRRFQEALDKALEGLPVSPALLASPAFKAALEERRRRGTQGPPGGEGR